jgi:ubiquinone/menaquinone biosynthesis C-methylase UbiE
VGDTRRKASSAKNRAKHYGGPRTQTQGLRDHMNTTSNRDVYELPGVVAQYRDLSDLQAPERSIVRTLGPRLSHMRMLDIGVGGGRTTVHFAPLVKGYVGIDYSSAMIEVCKGRFGVEHGKRDFFVVDARRMRIFKDAQFDFGLFSFNGIDCIEYDERCAVLTEARRVCRRGASFAFSTHNIRALERVYRFRMSASPYEWKYEALRFIRFRYYNGLPRRLAKRPHAMIRDSAEGFRLRACHIAPETQIRQLEQLGFKDIRTFGVNGDELSRGAAAASRDPWLYFLSTV